MKVDDLKLMQGERYQFIVNGIIIVGKVRELVDKRLVLEKVKVGDGKSEGALVIDTDHIAAYGKKGRSSAQAI